MNKFRLNGIKYELILRKLGNGFVFLRDDKGNPIISVGPHWMGFLFTICLEIVGFYMMLNMLNVRSQEQKTLEYTILMINILKCFDFLMLVLSLIFLMKVGLKDPGYVLKKILINNNYDVELDMENNILLHKSNQHRENNNNFCDICSITQPTNAEHCYECGLCVLMMDHHCPWMGRCVAQNNMYDFIIFNILWVIHLSSFALSAIFL